MSVLEDFSGVDVDDMLQMRKKNCSSFFFYMLLHMYSMWAYHQNSLSTMRPKCNVQLHFQYSDHPMHDSVNDKSESWCFCRVVLTIDFVFTGLMSM